MEALYSSGEKSRFELCFEPLRDGSPVMAFPCDNAGRVDMDAMAEPVLNSYLFARAVIGHHYALPQVRQVIFIVDHAT